MMVSDTLPKHTLGSTGITVSCLGLGTVKIGRNQGVKYPSGFSLPDDRQVQTLLETAREQGINLLDTAPAYGSSEERLGKLLTRREDWILCSKVGEEFENGQSRFDFSADHLRFSLERSLRRLGTDYLDIVLIHSDGRDREILEQSDCLETLQRCREEGLIRAFGMSTKTVEGGLLAVKTGDVVMLTYNPSATEDGAVIDEALARNKGVLVKKALNSGHLIADKAQTDSVASSMSFVFSRKGVSSIIIGSINPAHIISNCAAAKAALAIRDPDRTHTG